MLVYEQNGAPLPADGAARCVSSSPSETNVNQVADGHLWSSGSTGSRCAAPCADWKVKMYGLKRKDGTRQTYTLDRASYDSCATPGCHGFVLGQPDDQQDVDGRAALPLHRQGRRRPRPRRYGAYNEALALRGYRIKLVVGDGQVRDHRFADHPQPDQDPARQQAAWARS